MINEEQVLGPTISSTTSPEARWSEPPVRRRLTGRRSPSRPVHVPRCPRPPGLQQVCQAS